MDAELESWVREQLPVRAVELLRHRPWASVWRVATADGLWWLKVNAAGTSYEPRLLAVLGDVGF